VAGRVADFIELGELMVDDALMRNESCGGHFRVESQTPDGEALRDDENFAFVAAWEFKGENQPEKLNKEELTYLKQYTCHNVIMLNIDVRFEI
jgi:succinate dehydrogenase / fumarate reductase flavoprotein subunit